MHENRQKLISRLKSDLFGPMGGEGERLIRRTTPHTLYSLGILFPKEDRAGPEEADLTATQLGGPPDLPLIQKEEEPDDSPLGALTQKKPVSAGLTFAVEDGTKLQVCINAAAYNLEEVVDEDLSAVDSEIPDIDVVDDSDETAASKSFEWVHSPHPEERFLIAECNYREVDKTVIFGGKAELRVRWRFSAGRQLVTLTIVNTCVPTQNEFNWVEPSDCIFQAALRAEVSEGRLLPPPVPKFTVDDEEQELALRYRNKVQWATGHGCSASWSSSGAEGGTPNFVEIDYLPVSFVHRFLHEPIDDCLYEEPTLSIQQLATVESAERLREILEPFVADFERWLAKTEGTQVPDVFLPAKQRILTDLNRQAKRLHHGLNVLTSNQPNILESFKKANLAILQQMQLMTGRGRFSSGESSAKWRPFQLAFQLLALPGIVSEDEESGREILDLIWFPTGGGKTEAYLLLSAFTIIYRRMQDPKAGGGTAVISRYTLRLLTQDQFLRTATLICCLELMRREGSIPGVNEISIGLWIGKKGTPNKYSEALLLHRRSLTHESPVNNFMLQKCPLCGSKIIPDRNTGEEVFGVEASENNFYLKCPNASCDFSDRLPIQVVDQALYDSPPSILLGTIDKFAAMAWDHRCRSFFGLGVDNRPPDLIIQDELHLISGPLGSVAAIYESAIDVAMQHAGMRPKYVAATATIRGAKNQVQRLYARDVAIFPSPGIDASDSYYMTEDPDLTSARCYVGYMGQGHTPVMSNVHLMSSALQAGGSITDEDDYWSAVVYHNSKKDLGKTLKLARSSVPFRMQDTLHREADTSRKNLNVLELSANVQGFRLPEALSQARIPRDEEGCVDLIACTNMISVGVDISRLNLMIVLGQPKTTAEYIQATSRVGRSSNASGLVLASLSASRPRDRSHYESFRSFHSSYYRYVESSSVTPGSPGACDRALHAAIVAAIRLSVLPDDNFAGQYERDKFKDLEDRITERILRAVGADLQASVSERIEDVFSWWAESSAHYSARLKYRSEGKLKGLLCDYSSESPHPSKKTLWNMRHVEGEAAFDIHDPWSTQNDS